MVIFIDEALAVNSELQLFEVVLHLRGELFYECQRLLRRSLAEMLRIECVGIWSSSFANRSGCPTVCVTGGGGRGLYRQVRLIYILIELLIV